MGTWAPLFHARGHPPRSLFSPLKRANREETTVPAAAPAPPLSHEPRAHRRGESRRIRCSEMYSCRLGLVFVARLCPALGSCPTTRMAVLNKLSLDPNQSRRAALCLVSDLWARLPGGLAVAAAASLLRLLSSDSVVVAMLVPVLLRSLGGILQERGWWPASFLAPPSADSRCWYFSAGLVVEGGRRCLFQPTLSVVPSGAAIRTSSGSSPADVLQSKRSRRWRIPIEVHKAACLQGSFSGSRDSGISSPSPASSAAVDREVRLLALYALDPKVLFVISCFVRVFCVKCRVVLAVLECSGRCDVFVTSRLFE
jgi:hypothetical protein